MLKVTSVFAERVDAARSFRWGTGAGVGRPTFALLPGKPRPENTVRPPQSQGEAWRARTLAGSQRPRGDALLSCALHCP